MWNVDLVWRQTAQYMAQLRLEWTAEEDRQLLELEDSARLNTSHYRRVFAGKMLGQMVARYHLLRLRPDVSDEERRAYVHRLRQQTRKHVSAALAGRPAAAHLSSGFFLPKIKTLTIQYSPM